MIGIYMYTNRLNGKRYIGKFYKLHPAALRSSGPVIGIGFPAFEEGTVKDE